MVLLDPSLLNSLNLDVIQYRTIPSKENGEALGTTFFQLAKSLMGMYTLIVPEKDSDDYRKLHRKLALDAFTHVDTYDECIGSAFGYFTTCMLNLLRKEYRKCKEQYEIEERYGRYIPPSV